MYDIYVPVVIQSNIDNYDYDPEFKVIGYSNNNYDARYPNMSIFDRQINITDKDKEYILQTMNSQWLNDKWTPITDTPEV